MDKEIIIVRGLPSSGKTMLAEELKGDDGVVFSTDEYWYKVNFPNRPEEYSFNRNLIDDAHKWNALRAQRAVDLGHPKIIIDNTNSSGISFCCSYFRYAHFQGYNLRIEEPKTSWWLEIRELLQHKHYNEKELKKWAKWIFNKNKETHYVPYWVIERMMFRWECDLDPMKVLENCLELHENQT